MICNVDLEYTLIEVGFNESRPNDETIIETGNEPIKLLNRCKDMNRDADNDTEYIVTVEYKEINK